MGCSTNYLNTKQQDHFFFKPTDSLRAVCNAPPDRSGVYVVYALRHGRIELVYIGRSGKVSKDGKTSIRKAGLGGMKDRIVNGHQFGKIPRKISWPVKMMSEDIEALDIYWYVTHDENRNDCPRALENILLMKHMDIYGRLPAWNKGM